MTTEPTADRAALRDRIAEALMRWADGNNNPRFARRSETVRANAYSRADAVLAVLPEASATAVAPAEWIDGHPQLEAIAATVWERCQTQGTSLVVDDPRNIAVAVLAARPVPPAPAADSAVLRERVANVLADADGWTWAPGFDRRRSPAYQAYLTRADRVVGLLTAYDTTMRAAVLLEAAAIAESLRQFEPATGARKAAQVSENVGILRVATELRRLAAGAQQQPTTETQPPRYRWRVETRDGIADEWAPGTAYLNRHHAVERYKALTEHHPMWKDGTPVERRIVREATTYTVETPSARPGRLPAQPTPKDAP